MPGWTEEKASGDLRVWRDKDGDVLVLAVPQSHDPMLDCRSEAEIRRAARLIAEERGGGLIEATAIAPPPRSVVSLVYKRLELPAYIYTGMLVISRGSSSLVWTIVAGEQGTTGVREAIITAELMKAGELTPETYGRLWARDPYDPTYRGVNRSVLRFLSDDRRYDERFPQHPLSKVRRILAGLPGAVTGVQ
jgi:hypothetical protein